MRVGIIAANNIRYSPYIFFYANILEKASIDYELIFPNRTGVCDEVKFKTFELPWNQHSSTLHNYFSYSKSVVEILKKEKYDAVIVLTTNNAVFLSPWLRFHMNDRYIIDIRDYTHENVPIYYLLEKMALNHSLVNVISSKKFVDFLPSAQYKVCHNISDNSKCALNMKKSMGPIVIGYIGKGGYLEQCKQLIALIDKDNRFALHCYGPKVIEDELRDCCNQYKNASVEFHGAFTPIEKSKIISDVDLLFNIYGNGTPLLDCALSNKLYDALQFVKPILTSPDTYMSEMAGPLSFAVDFAKQGNLDSLYKWYSEIDGSVVCSFASSTLEKMIKENAETENRIVNCLLAICS